MTGKNILDPKERFAFGKNWSRFLENLTEDHILEAQKSLAEKLGTSDLSGKIFLDIGSGSGLFSLAAHRFGAVVYSFDYDEDSVACTRYLWQTYGGGDDRWSVAQGSVLDSTFLKQYQQADIVYSWGVLHHTGHMYAAFENVAPLVKKGGMLFISIYNDQGGPSRRWKKIKQCYNGSGPFVRFLLLVYTLFRQWTVTFIKDFLTLKPFRSWIHYGVNNRGMSAWHDLVDWVGGYPFEVAKPEEVFDFFKGKGFVLNQLKTCAGGLGCNEFVFYKQ